MKKITKALTALLIVGLFFSCKHNNSVTPDEEPKSDPNPKTEEPAKEEKVPEDAMRYFTAESKATAWSIYGVEDLEKLSEVVNGGKNFSGKTVTVKNDIIINQKVLSDDFEEPAEGAEEGTPNPNLKNLNSIGTGKSPEGGAVRSFSGTFDGNGKVISGLYMYQGHQGLGLIGVADGAVIKNVILVDACIINKNVAAGKREDDPHDSEDDDRFGGIIGLADGDGAEIENCLFAGVVGSEVAKARGKPYEYIGGLVGYANADTTLTDCFVFARINGSHKDIAVGNKPENVTRENVNGEDGKGIDVTDFEGDLAAEIAEAIKTVKANVE